MAARLLGEPWIKINPSSVFLSNDSFFLSFVRFSELAKNAMEGRIFWLKVLSSLVVGNYYLTPLLEKEINLIRELIRDYYPLSTFENLTNFSLRLVTL